MVWISANNSPYSGFRAVATDSIFRCRQQSRRWDSGSWSSRPSLIVRVLGHNCPYFRDLWQSPNYSNCGSDTDSAPPPTLPPSNSVTAAQYLYPIPRRNQAEFPNAVFGQTVTAGAALQHQEYACAFHSGRSAARSFHQIILILYYIRSKRMFWQLPQMSRNLPHLPSGIIVKQRRASTALAVRSSQFSMQKELPMQIL